MVTNPDSYRETESLILHKSLKQQTVLRSIHFKFYEKSSYTDKAFEAPLYERGWGCVNTIFLSFFLQLIINQNITFV